MDGLMDRHGWTDGWMSSGQPARQTGKKIDRQIENIDWIVFYSILAIFQPNNGSNRKIG